MAISMRSVKVASAAAFAIAGLMVVAAASGELLMAVFASIPLLAGVGIARRRIWSAYGFALFLLAQVLLLPFMVWRSGGMRPGFWQAAGAVGVMAALIALFYAAGKSLQTAGGRRGPAWPWIALSAVCLAGPVFMQPFVMPTNSMQGTLLAGDRVLVWRVPKPAPVRDRLVTFLYPVDRKQVFVKRVIGAPGDRIRIANKTVYRNGDPLREPYAIHETSYTEPYRDNFPGEPGLPLPSAGLEMLAAHVKNGEVIVPEGHYFVLGDNRDNSLDSRYWGFVAADDVVGRPVLIYDSQDGARHIRWNRLLRTL